MNNPSNWERNAERSQYHFDNDIVDPRWDTVINVGKIEPFWDDELKQAIENSKPCTLWQRGATFIDSTLHESEKYDLVRAGIDSEVIISNLAFEIPLGLRKICEKFGLENNFMRVHVQMPGQMWIRHIDKLHGMNSENPEQIMRFMIQLTDWQPGQFWEYGNYHYNRWKAGDVTTFDWMNVPHCTANAGFSPRVTLQVSGTRTEQTDIFLKELKNISRYNL